MGTPIAQLFDLTGRMALVTGGSRGPGLQIAEALGDAGAKVMLTARKAVALEAAVAQLQARGIDARWVAADASTADGVAKIVDDTCERLGDIDILVNNAGATWVAPAEARDKAMEVMDLNVRAMFLISQAVGQRCMIPRKSGRIINVASIAGLSGNSGPMTTIACSTGQGAVLNFTRALAGAWGRHGITVNALAPLHRLGDDDDLKGAAVLFASAAGKHITGQILAVDGGVSAVHGG